MNLLITGARGQLGRELVACSRLAGHAFTAVDIEECDITDPGAVDHWLAESSAEALVNCAAWTRVDAAEAQADAAYLVNATGPRVLADRCQAAGVLLTHISTDFIFDGAGTSPLDEEATPHPLSVYGASKLAGEQEVRSRCGHHQVVRTAWLYGQDGPNFVLTILRLAKERARLRVVSDQWGSPTWTGHLAPVILQLVELGVPGTFHLTNAGAATWHGLAQAVLEVAGLERTVEAISTADFPTAARRPAYSVLDNRAWRLLGQPALPPWQQGVRGYLQERSLVARNQVRG